jgi:hypothetical protein
MNEYATTAGTQLFYGDVDTDPSTPVTNISKIGGLPAAESSRFETTRVDQMDPDNPTLPDWYKKYAFGRIDPGNLEITVGHDDTAVATIYGLLRQEKAWKVKLSTGATMTFNGTLYKVAPEAGDNEVTHTLSIAVSGKLTFDPAP